MVNISMAEMASMAPTAGKDHSPSENLDGSPEILQSTASPFAVQSLTSYFVQVDSTTGSPSLRHEAIRKVSHSWLAGYAHWAGKVVYPLVVSSLPLRSKASSSSTTMIMCMRGGMEHSSPLPSSCSSPSSTPFWPNISHWSKDWCCACTWEVSSAS